MNDVYQKKVSTLDSELKRRKNQAIEEARSIIEKANAAVERTIKEIKHNAGSKDKIKEARKELHLVEKEFDELTKVTGNHPIDVVFHIGDTVMLKNSSIDGRVIAKIDKEHVQVLVGTLKVTVASKDIVHVTNNKVTVSATSDHFFEAEAKTEIDLRGMYGDEALIAIEQFFDSAIISGVHKVNLIHGKGTGALRRKINDYLKNHTGIKSFRLGDWNEGGSGVTVVELQ